MLRAACATLTIYVRFYALPHMPLADVAMICASTSLFVNVHARIFLKEPIQLVNVFNILMVLIGLVLIIKPPFLFGENDLYRQDPLALVCAIALTLAATVVNPLAPVVCRALKGES